MKRAEILDAAKVCVCGQREQDYGTPENNFATIGRLWWTYIQAAHPQLATSREALITPGDVAAMMALLKIARIATGTGTADSFVDLAGYAACAGELVTEKE